MTFARRSGTLKNLNINDAWLHEWEHVALTLRFLYLLFGWPGADALVLVARLLRMISMSFSAVTLSLTSNWACKTSATDGTAKEGQLTSG